MMRLEILKTYKLYIGGKFPRTESGRYHSFMNGKEHVANVCKASRKDLRDAVVAARGAQSSWWQKSAYNRSQILYRIAEMMEGRKIQFVEELILQGYTKTRASKEVDLSIDRWVYYAGWCDKYQQIFSSVNPVASSHFNFSVLEPMGVICLLPTAGQPLLEVISMVAPAIAAGNSVIVVNDLESPLSVITLGEVLHTSDLPGGVVNILTAHHEELLPHLSVHMDINAVLVGDMKPQDLKTLQKEAAVNVKRVSRSASKDLLETLDPYLMRKLSEVKTTWHPIEAIGASGSGY
ncbi:MAG: aldehyde dehydrogenase family protein [Bacteroidetes bacterium]|jgi:acyl-CoA reductase-like NAD-dependent aldehyde dehydrogenase|nr:aldehyde dehydrogenase family protein [Bacteroidota bacterium]